jgi:alpha-tubulin suppressor-like RCC1 family protein
LYTNVPTGLTNVIAIAAASGYSLALRNDRTVIAWGYNSGLAETNVPVGLSDVTAIAAGEGHCLALKKDGSVIQWGANDAPPDLTNVVRITCSAGHCLTLKADGSISAWGSYYNPGPPPEGTQNVADIGSGFSSSMAIDTTGKLTVWGDGICPQDLSGLQSISTHDSHLLAVRDNGSILEIGGSFVPRSFSNAVAVAAELFGSVVLDANGTAWEWATTDFQTSFLRAVVSNVVAIAGGHQHCLMLRSDGSVTGFGLNSFGQATPPPNLTNVIAIAAGYNHSVALDKSGTMHAWGDNSYGQTFFSSQPGVAAIAAGDYVTAILWTNGYVAMCGPNPSRPVSFPNGASNVVTISCGQYSTLSVRADHSVVGWGTNFGFDFGQNALPAQFSNFLDLQADGYDTTVALVPTPVHPCSIECPSDIQICNDTGSPSAQVYFPQPLATNCDGLLLSYQPPSGAIFPIGTNIVICGPAGLSGDITNLCHFSVIVNDCEPPKVEAISAVPPALWPPNHKMISVSLRASAKDNFSPTHSRISSIISSDAAQPRVGADADWEITGDLTARLRAARSGPNPRTYLITVATADETGNSTMNTVSVSVENLR